MKKILATLALAVSVGVLGFAAPAQAALSCPNTGICLWKGADGTGRRLLFTISGIPGGMELPPDWAGVGSVYNNTYTWLYLWDGRTCAGSFYRLPAYTYYTGGAGTVPNFFVGKQSITSSANAGLNRPPCAHRIF